MPWGQFYSVQNILTNEKITFVRIFVHISATAQRKTGMAAYFRPKIGFRPTDAKLLVWQKCYHHMICSLGVQKYFIAQTYFESYGASMARKGVVRPFFGVVFLDLRELCGSNQKMLVHNLEERKKQGKLVFEVCRSEQQFPRKLDFSEKFAKILVSRVTIREKAM